MVSRRISCFLDISKGQFYIQIYSLIALILAMEDARLAPRVRCKRVLDAWRKPRSSVRMPLTP